VQEQLIGLTVGVLQTGRLGDVLQMYKEALAKDAKQVIASALQSLPSNRSTDEQPDSAAADEGKEGKQSVALRLRAQDAAGFQALLDTMLQRLLAVLRRAANVREIVLAVVSAAQAELSAAGGDEPLRDSSALAADGTVTAAYVEQVCAELRELLVSVCELVHGRVARLMLARQEATSKLSLLQFQSLFESTWQFVVITDKIAGKAIFGLKGSLTGQCKSWLDTFHEMNHSKLRALLDQETWAVANVPAEFQLIVDTLHAECQQVRMHAHTQVRAHTHARAHSSHTARAHARALRARRRGCTCASITHSAPCLVAVPNPVCHADVVLRVCHVDCVARAHGAWCMARALYGTRSADLGEHRRRDAARRRPQKVPHAGRAQVPTSAASGRRHCTTCLRTHSPKRLSR
jgi:hypothetical protein